MLRRFLVVATATFALALPGTRAAAQINNPHGYAVGLGGMGATQVNAGMFGGNVGFNLTPDLIVTGEVSRTQDVFASFTKEDLSQFDTGMSDITGLTSKSQVKMPTNYYTAGLRYLLPIGRSIRPYVAGSGGVAHMSPAPTFSIAGIDFTKQAMEEELFKTSFREETRPVAALGGGVSVMMARHLAFDFGYRYSAIFIHTDYLQDPASPHSHTRLDTHRMYAGVGVAF